LAFREPSASSDSASGSSRSISRTYRGRFAPSPTGPLHFGSLVTAIASYLQARAKNGEWLIRIEDIDPPRELAGADQEILQTLDAHGFEWDEEPMWQSTRLEAYEQALKGLHDQNLAYICHCTRKGLSATAQRGPLGLIYPGTCKQRQHPYSTERATRIRTDGALIRFHDQLQGNVELNLEQDVGDFLLRRGDGLIAYHAAATVDDEFQGITEVVRGHDLCLSSPCHIHLQKLLGYNSPNYMHLPVAVNTDGQKLSKQSYATPLASHDAAANLVRGLSFLEQKPPTDLESAPIGEIWCWATENWSPAPLKGLSSKPEIGHFK
jgi:glutamyl-Q tRNA(Asp) synthetase